MKLKIFGAALTAMLLLTLTNVMAQSYAQSAMLFGRTTPGGSARILGMGGTQIALGGDYSSGISNPAGLGMFNRSEVSLSTGVSSLTSSAKFLGNTDDDLKNRLTIPGFGVVLNFPQDKNGFMGGSFGISYTRTNDFNQSVLYQGQNEDNTSIINYFISDAKGYPISQFDEDEYQYNRPTGLAYYNYLIGPETLLDPPGSDREYFSDVFSNAYQQETIQTTGSSGQWNFSYGANIKDKLFLGIGLGVASLRYKSTKSYSESFEDDDYLDNLRLDENLTIKGSGANLTVGITGRPVDFLQLGASYSTPTLYSISETYDASMNTNWNNFDYFGDGKTVLNDEYAETDIVKSDYMLVLPSKVSTGLAFISKYGLISGDLEVVNVGGARYSSSEDGVSYSTDNDQIRSAYRRVLNYRLGAEFRHKIVRARAGYGVQGNTYKSSAGSDNTIRNISGGVGLRMKRFFVDFALVFSKGNVTYSPYPQSANVNLTNKLIKGVVTAGVTF